MTTSTKLPMGSSLQLGRFVHTVNRTGEETVCGDSLTGGTPLDLTQVRQLVSNESAGRCVFCKLNSWH